MNNPESLGDYLKEKYWPELWERHERAKKRMTDRELLEIFPEIKEMFDQKLRELRAFRAEVLKDMECGLCEARRRAVSEFELWLLEKVIEEDQGAIIEALNSEIARFKRLKAISEGKVSKDMLTDELIQEAKNVPIQSLISTDMRRSGRTLITFCPFHKEKHPSFYVYPETNSCWCFGCNQGGDAIKFVQLLHGFTFKEAVQYLLKG